MTWRIIPKLYLLLIILAIPGMAQNPEQWKFTTISPNGSACTSRQAWVLMPQGLLFTCQSGTAKLYDGGGPLNVLGFGATGNGTTNDYAAIQSGFTACAAASTSLYFPPGTYLVNTALTSLCPIEMDPSATIKAGAAMSQVITLGSGSYVNNGYWHGGTVDANDLANDGILLDQFRHFSMASVTVKSALVNYFHVGNGSGVYTSFEFIARDLHGIRNSGTLAAGSAGLLIDTNATDNNIAGSVFVGAESGMVIKTGGNFFTDIHTWSAAAQGWMVNGFDDQANGNFWKGIEADTPQTYGLRARGFNSTITNSRFYNNSTYGQDNVAVGIFFDQTTPAATVNENFFTGADASHRWAADLTITNYGNSVIVGNIESNVVGQFAFTPKFGGGLIIYSGTTASQRYSAEVAQMRNTGVFGFVAGTSVSTSTASDTGFSRCGVAASCFGNGTAGDFSGSVKTAAFISTAATCAGVSLFMVSDGTCHAPTGGFAGNTAGNSIAASTTSYLGNGSTSPSTTQSQRAWSVSTAGTLKNFYIRTETTQNAGGTMVCSVTQNGSAASAITVTITAGGTAQQWPDTTHTVTVAAGDILSIQCVNNYTGGVSAILGAWSVGLY